MQTADIAILAAYLLIIIAVCARVTKRSPNADELFLASRSLGPAVIGLSLFASNISSTTLVGTLLGHGISLVCFIALQLD